LTGKPDYISVTDSDYVFINCMDFFSKFFIKLTSTLIGQDKFGNSYYESQRLDWLGRKKRSVIYNGLSEASKIQSQWFAWLHHQTDTPPESNSFAYAWQKPRLPNLTGTKQAYFPALHLKSKKRDSVPKVHYQAWRPNQP